MDNVCPNCNAKIFSSLMSSNNFIPDSQTSIINEYHISDPKSKYCHKCGDSLYQKYKNILGSELSQIRMLFEEMIPKMPIVTIQNPYGWKYKIKGMVTGQSTTGTGVISEFASGFTDFFGMQSGRHNDKIRAGEELCAYQLKMKAFNMGADAIVGVDIDYAELGGGKGMIMVCMSGTAVELENKEIFGEWFEDYAKKLQENQIRYAHLSKLDKKS